MSFQPSSSPGQNPQAENLGRKKSAFSSGLRVKQHQFFAKSRGPGACHEIVTLRSTPAFRAFFFNSNAEKFSRNLSSKTQRFCDGDMARVLNH
jgi:hypothetical protein